MDFLKYIWTELKRISCWRILRDVGILVVIAAIWLAMQPHIDRWLSTFLSKWIAPMEPYRAIAALYAIIGFLMVGYVWAKSKKMAHMSIAAVMVWTVIIALYTYYRNLSCGPFVFWGNGNIYWLDILYVVTVFLAGCELSYWIDRWNIYKANVAESEELLILDAAINDEEDDIFGYSLVAQQLAQQINSIDLSQKAFSVGITGEWGVGKSSLLNLFARDRKREDQIVIRFAPRNAKKVDLIQEEFFAELTNELEKYSCNAHYLIGKYLYALNIDSSTKWIYYIADWFTHWTAESKKAQINDMIRMADRKLYVIIEDLDRLTGPEIIEVLKLIDANGNFCNTVFLSAYDKTYVNSVLREHIKYTISRPDFTDKYFQYEFPLFQQQREILYGYLHKYIYNWALQTAKDDAVRRNIESEWNYVCGRLLDHLPTVRHIKRYVNLFRIGYKQDWGKVDFGDYVIISLIRYLDADAYYSIFNKTFVTYPKTFLTVDTSHYVLDKEYKELAKHSKIKKLETLLEYLFMGQSGHRQFDPVYNRIFRAESFDNYFYRYKKGKIYTGDLNLIMNAQSLPEAIGIMKRYIGISSAAKSGIEEYLNFFDISQIRNSERLKRYVSMLIYAADSLESLYLHAQLYSMLSTEKRNLYKEKVPSIMYENAVSEAFDDMMTYSPLFIARYLRDRLSDRYENPEGNKDLYIDTIQQDESWLEAAIRHYYQAIEDVTWSAKTAIEIASKIRNEDESFYTARATQLTNIMNAYPDMFAEAILRVQPSDNRGNTIVEIEQCKTLVEIMGGEDAFGKWIRKIKNADLRQVIRLLFRFSKAGYAARTQIELQVGKPAEQYDQIAKELKKVKISKR